MWYLITSPYNGKQFAQMEEEGKVLGGSIEWLESIGYTLTPAVVMTEKKHRAAIEQAYQRGYDAGQGLKG